MELSQNSCFTGFTMVFMGGVGLESILGHGKLGSWLFGFAAVQGAPSSRTVLRCAPSLTHPTLGKQAYAMVCPTGSKPESCSVYP